MSCALVAEFGLVVEEMCPSTISWPCAAARVTAADSAVTTTARRRVWRYASMAVTPGQSAGVHTASYAYVISYACFRESAGNPRTEGWCAERAYCGLIMEREWGTRASNLQASAATVRETGVPERRSRAAAQGRFARRAARA